MAAVRPASPTSWCGAAATLADMSGYSKAAHIKDKLNQMMHLTETLWCCALACSAEGKPTACGSYFVDPLLANVDKHNVTSMIYEIDRLAQDVGGGLLATIPSQKDLENPEIGKYIEKYLHGVEGYSTEDRIRMARLVEVMTGGVALVESMHGAGSPGAEGHVRKAVQPGGQEKGCSEDCGRFLRKVISFG